MLIIKDFLHKIYLKICNSKLIKWIFPIFIICLVPNVFASEMFFGPNAAIDIYNGNTRYISIDGTTNNLPKTFYLNAGQDMNLGVIDMYFSPASGNINVLDTFNYNYLIIDGCSTGNMSFVISNSSCGNSCVASGTYQPVSAGTCSVDGYNASRYLYQIPIQKWYLNDVSELLETSSYIHLVNSLSFAPRIRINQIFLSNEDYTLVYKNQADLINKLNSVQTTITNMQNSINNNANTNTQNIINNQNSNTNSLNNNIDQEFSDLKNQDHNYNNNSSDNLNGQSDLDNMLNKENQLKNSINLDSSSVDIQFNSSATTWIWDIISNFRISHAKITLLITSILSLAIIKMVLNR